MTERQPRQPVTRQAPPKDCSNHSYSNDHLNLRRRGSARTSISSDDASGLQDQRRNSTISDTVSETRNSIRSSTGNLFFPRASGEIDGDHDSSSVNADSASDESLWNSAPLLLALLPAVAGVFFRNGSAFITDVTILIMAAVFLNWSVRLPWDWYHSAQTIRRQHDTTPVNGFSSDSTHDEQIHSIIADEPLESREQDGKFQGKDVAAKAATVELHAHELAALASCFIFPVVGTWVLHLLRSNLSRPSEGLVSNYNLTIFLLASELRPCAHLLRMVQSRTLFLQRVVASSSSAYDDNRITGDKAKDINKRLEEIEAHVAETAAIRLALSNPAANQDKTPSSSSSPSEATSQLATEVRDAFHAEVKTLHRAVKRHEKRTASYNRQTESRLQLLETHIRRASPSHAVSQPLAIPIPSYRGLVSRLLSWAYAVVTAPARLSVFVARLLARFPVWLLRSLWSITFVGKKEVPLSAQPSAPDGPPRKVG